MKVPFDQWWRERYKVPFNSFEHRRANPVDMFLEYCEHKIVRQELALAKIYELREKRYQEGQWATPLRKEADLDFELFQNVSLDSLTQALRGDGEG